jgi:membrane-associated phospholipid phosphatase
VVVGSLADEYTLAAWDAWFPFEQPVHNWHSPRIAGLSDGALLLALSAPLAFSSAQDGLGRRFVNSVVIHGESLAATNLLTALSKVTFRRARPYTHAANPELIPEMVRPHSDRNLSFISGHSAMAFTSSTAGGLLFADGSSTESSRFAFWATELALATATASWRVRAARHYPSDVVMGALLGSAIGVLVPLAHGVRPAMAATDAAGIATGIALGASLAWLLPARERLSAATSDAGVTRTTWLLTPTDDGSGAFVSLMMSTR